MSEELKPCEHGRNFCMDCHYPKGKFKTLPAMYDGLAAENQCLRTELAALKAGQGEVVAEVVSAYGDPEAFGEREVKVLADLSKIPYGTKLYTDPPASADAVSVPRELLARVCADRSNGPSYAFKAIEELRAMLAQSESKVKP